MKNAKTFMCLLITGISLLADAQNSEKGIQWATGLSWEQVKQKAKQEDKYIFLDCYATWCGPCKAMDQNVYPSVKLGDFVNDKFVSIKVQMDTSVKDNADTKKWYSDAHFIMQKYGVLAYPTFLFFSPDGKIVHRDVGYKKEEDFMSLAADALDSAKQYYSLLEKYNNGIRDYSSLPGLAKIVKVLGDDRLAKEIAKDYKQNYLDHLPDSALFTKDHIQFIGFYFPELIFEDGSNGRYFKYFYKDPNAIDKLVDWKAFATTVINAIIGAEEIDRKLWLNEKPITKSPDWSKITATISKKYSSDYAKTLVSSAKPSFYLKTGNWKEYAKLREEKIKKNPPKPGTGISSDAWGLNSDAWNVFLECNDKTILRKALDWSELSMKLESDPRVYVQFYDTKANLLYKLGKVKDAIEWEEKAIELDKANAKKAGREKAFLAENEYYPNLAKMKQKEPTWPVKQAR